MCPLCPDRLMASRPLQFMVFFLSYTAYRFVPSEREDCSLVPAVGTICCICVAVPSGTLFPAPMPLPLYSTCCHNIHLCRS